MCSAIAATASKDKVLSRGHKVEEIESFPIIVSDDIESISKASELSKVLDSLKLSKDVERLQTRKPRSGQSSLRGRAKKVGLTAIDEQTLTVETSSLENGFYMLEVISDTQRFTKKLLK